MQNITLPLFIFEMANNHMGNIEHGLNIIRTYGELIKKYKEFNFAIKLQYRSLDTFIHPLEKKNSNSKLVKRFLDTRLSASDFELLIKEIKKFNFISIATPFDEDSVDLILSHNLDIIKVASCSFNDWPLLEKIVDNDKPIIASTAGASIDNIDKVVNFFKNRKKSFSILHCVGEYPTPLSNLHLSQVDFLKSRYPDVEIGFSTHEDPNDFDIIKIAISKGVQIFEKHIGLPTNLYKLNEYSANPDQIKSWLDSAKKTFLICGEGSSRKTNNEKELQSLRSLRRGIFAKNNIKKGELIKLEDIFFAFPPDTDQYTANDWSKYVSFISKYDIAKDSPLTTINTVTSDSRTKIYEIVERVKELLFSNNVIVPGNSGLEISHHYGIDEFYNYGLVLITVVNRNYCKKLLVSLPKQVHPEQYHNDKEETFLILAGEVFITLNGVEKSYMPGDVITVMPGVKHSFYSNTGSVIEEISTTHIISDSHYTDEKINTNPNRKTYLNFWMD